MSALAAAYASTRKDPLGALLAAAVAAGVRLRWSGADLRIEGLARLPAPDQELFARQLPAITARLAEPAGDDGAAALAALGIVAIALVVNAERARDVIRGLSADVGLDIETEAPIEWPWLAITAKGQRSKMQLAVTDKAGLDPHRARPRLIQVYEPSTRAVSVFDLHRVPLEALAELWSRRLWIHNAGFELAMLGAQGVTLTRVVDTQQIAGLVLGCGPGSRRLENVCQQILDVEISKEQQLSDWSAPRLSLAQVNYAAVDAAAAFEAGRAMLGMLDERTRSCFRLQNAAVPVVANMRLAGAPFDREAHLATIERWECELAEERAKFRAITGEDVPARHLVGPWIEAHLPADEVAWMPRTTTGALSARSHLLKHLAHRAEIRPLLRALWAQKRLEAFGHKLIAMADPTIGRIYPDYLVCGAKTGRLTSSAPSLQQMPRDGRAAIRAPAGRVLVRADLSQIELRVFAEEAGECEMRAVFAAGGDIHRRTAAATAGVPEEEIAKHDRRRTAAKAINFGIVFSASARTIRATAWSLFDIEMTEEEARLAKAAVLRAYPAIAPYQRRQEELGRAARVLHSRAGRPLRADWEKDNTLKYTTCSNYPIQSSAADVLLRSMVLLDREITGLAAQLILSVHDELVVEAAEDVAEDVERRLVAAMTRAFSEFYPDAPTLGLVETAVVRSWGDAK